MVFGEEKIGGPTVDDEEERTPSLFVFYRSEFLEVSPATVGHGVGEHGNPVTEEGARFDLQVNLLSSFFEEKVDPAAKETGLSRFDPGAFKPRYEVIFYEGGGNIVRPVGVEHDGSPRSYDRHRSELQSSARFP